MRSSTWLFAACAALAFGALCWALPRGFDITDEGFYLLSYGNPDDVPTSWTLYHRLVGATVGRFAPSIVSYRVARLLLELAATGGLALALGRFLRRHGAPPNGSLHPFLLLGTLTTLAFGPRTLSYNSIVDAALLSHAALTIVALTPGTGRGSRLAAAAGVGAAYGLLFLAKPPSGAVAVMTTSALFLLGRRLDTLAVALAVGAITAGGALLTWPPDFTLAARVAGGDHAPLTLLRAYADDAVRCLRELVAYVPFFALEALHRSSWTRGRAWYWSLASAAAFAVPTLALERHRAIFVDGYVALLFAAVLRLPSERRRALATRERAVGVVTLWLATLPLVGSIGSGNMPLVQVFFHLTPWFAVVWLAVLGARPVGVCRHRVLLLTAALALLHIADAALLRPYRVPGSLAAQDRALAGLPAARGLRFDAAVADFLSTLTAAAARAGLRPGTPVIALYDAPGLVFLLGGSSPMRPWYFSGEENDAANCRAIQRTASRGARPWLLLERAIAPGQARCLDEAGLHFTDYRPVATLPNPYREQRPLHLLAPAGAPR